MLSVNTNVGAMTALQYLNQTQARWPRPQNAISTGLKVASAKDNGAIYAIAQNMRGDVAGYTAVTDSLNRGTSAVDVAMSAGQSISDLLIQMKQKALSASDTSLDTASRQAMNQDFAPLRDQITTIVKNAAFNGFNLINGSTSQITALASSDGTRRITVQRAEHVACPGRIVTIAAAGIDLDRCQGVDDGRDDRDFARPTSNSALAKLSAGSTKFSIQATFAQNAVRYADDRHRQPGRRQHGPGKRPAHCVADQAAARHSGVVDRQPGAFGDSVSVPVSTTQGGGRNRGRRCLSEQAGAISSGSLPEAWAQICGWVSLIRSNGRSKVSARCRFSGSGLLRGHPRRDEHHPRSSKRIRAGSALARSSDPHPVDRQCHNVGRNRPAGEPENNELGFRFPDQPIPA